MYHGILIDQEFKDPSFPKTYPIFANKQIGSWHIYGIKIENSEIEREIQKIQSQMKPNGNWYAHFYNNEKLIIVFKNKTFNIKPDSSTWKPAIEYGRKLGISEKQLDFHPSKFQSEREYFNE